MRKFLSHVFVLLINYYFLAFLVGTVLAAVSIVERPLPFVYVGFAALASFLVSLGYQFTRSRWRYQSIGERLLGSTSKTTISEQRNNFGVTRALLLFMMLMTLMLNGNTQDGLTRGAAYTIVDLLLFATMLLVQYRGFSSFIERPSIPPIITIAALIFVVAIAMQSGYRELVSGDIATLTGDNISRLYKGLSIVWLFVGYYYQNHYQGPVQQDALDQ